MTDQTIGARSERLATDRQAFEATWPAWATTGAIDRLRAEDFSRLDEQQHVYLDYTGGGLYGTSQVARHSEFMCAGVFGNPHSGNPASLKMTDHVEATRHKVLEFFNASPDDYTVIFTPNASGALKLVGEAYPFRKGGCFALSADNHNSVNGIREFAAAKNAEVVYLPLSDDGLRLRRDVVLDTLADQRWHADRLFAFPAQSNFTGVKHPLDLVSIAQEKGWDVMLDAAAFAPTSPLDLSEVGADFVSLSFYKMFGYPTGIGALIARRDKLPKLDRPWFAGGTIQIASVGARDHYMAHDEAGFEDGTVNYLLIPAVTEGLAMMADVGMETIATRVRCLTGWLLQEITALAHDNGRPMAKVHGPTDTADRGGTITINLYDPDGVPYRGARLEELAGEACISIRTGCFCNPGAGEKAHELDAEILLRWFNQPTDIGFQELVAEVRDLTGKEVSAIRISVGLVSTFEDAWRLMRFLESLRNQGFDDIGLPGEQLHLRDSG